MQDRQLKVPTTAKEWSVLAPFVLAILHNHLGMSNVRP